LSQPSHPFVWIADRIRHEVVDRGTAGARRQFAGDGAGLLGAARGAAGDLENPGSEIAQHAGKRPALVVVAMAGRVAAVLGRHQKAEGAVSIASRISRCIVANSSSVALTRSGGGNRPLIAGHPDGGVAGGSGHSVDESNRELACSSALRPEAAGLIVLASVIG
jgi:hypothetical protein